MEKTIVLFGKRLYIHDDSIIDIKEVVTLPIFVNEKKEKFFILPLDNKTVQINYGLFLLYINDSFYLPCELWNKVKVGFLDNDLTNYDLKNLYLIYPKEGIRCDLKNKIIEHFEDKVFYYIPSFERNIINKNADIINIDTLEVVSVSGLKLSGENNQTYPYVVLTNNKIKTTRLLHRINAITFLNPPLGYPNLVVDHINGKKYDFRLDNLEWVTSKENNVRAVETGLRSDNKRLIVKDMVTGEIKEYFSITEMARQFGVHPQYVVDGMKNKNQTYKKRYIIKSVNDERPWEYFEGIKLTGEAIGVKAKHVITGEILHFVSTKQASKVLKISQNGIAQYFKHSQNPCIINGFEWKLENDETPWHEFNEYQIEIWKRGLHRNTTVYQYTDVNTGEVNIAYGWKPLNELTNVCKRQIINIGSYGGVLANRYRLKILH